MVRFKQCFVWRERGTNIVKAESDQEVLEALVSGARPEVADLLGLDVGTREGRAGLGRSGNLDNGQRRDDAVERLGDTRDGGDKGWEAELSLLLKTSLRLDRPSEGRGDKQSARESDETSFGNHGVQRSWLRVLGCFSDQDEARYPGASYTPRDDAPTPSSLMKWRAALRNLTPASPVLGVHK